MLTQTAKGQKRSEREGTARLAEFAVSLSFRDIPDHVVERCFDLFVDWVGSALSGARDCAVVAIDELAKEMGPEYGRELKKRKMAAEKLV